MSIQHEGREPSVDTPYEPVGIRFYANGRHMLLVEEGEWAGWLCYRHPEGQWVSLRVATDDDLDRIRAAAESP